MKITLTAEQYDLFHKDEEFKASIYKRCSDFLNATPPIESISIARVGQVTPFLTDITKDDPNVLAVTEGTLEINMGELHENLLTWYLEGYTGNPDTDTLGPREAQIIYDCTVIVNQLKNRRERLFIKDTTNRPVVPEPPEEGPVVPDGTGEEPDPGSEP